MVSLCSCLRGSIRSYILPEQRTPYDLDQMSQLSAKQEDAKIESDIAQKLAALQTKTDLEVEALLEATVTQGPGKYVSRYIPRSVAAPSFMDRKLQQLKVSFSKLFNYMFILFTYNIHNLTFQLPLALFAARLRHFAAEYFPSIL